MAVKQTDAEQARQQEQRQAEKAGQAEQRSGQPEQLSQGQRGGTQQATAPAQQDRGRERGLARTGLPVPAILSPFSLLQRFFTSDITDLLDEFGGSRGMRTQQPAAAGTTLTAWAPRVDVFQRGNELVIRADLPGITPDDVVVEISDDAVTISGERVMEREEDQGNAYRFERTYGAFYRVIPLPEGAIVDRATATFRDGVLEVTLPAPPEQVSRGRQLEITRGEQTGSSRGQTSGSREQASASKDQSADQSARDKNRS